MTDGKWTTVLRKLEREFDGLPPEPTPARPVSPVVLRARRASERQTLVKTLERRQKRNVVLGTTGRLVLVFALAATINFWPYGHACGFGLITYVAAQALIVVGGLWTAIWTWNQRIPHAHGVAMAMVLWGLVLLAGQVLPRVGYARVDPANPPHWWCAD